MKIKTKKLPHSPYNRLIYNIYNIIKKAMFSSREKNHRYLFSMAKYKVCPCFDSFVNKCNICSVVFCYIIYVCRPWKWIIVTVSRETSFHGFLPVLHLLWHLLGLSLPIDWRFLEHFYPMSFPPPSNLHCNIRRVLIFRI